MAENEVLDVAKGRRWLPLRRLLAEPSVQINAVLEEVVAGYERSLFAAIRGAPLAEILRAADLASPAALRAAVQQCKNKELARLIRDALKIVGCTNPNRVADEVLSMIRDGLCEKVRLHAMDNPVYQSEDACALIEQLRERLEACSPRIAEQLSASLQGAPVVLPRRRIAARSRGTGLPVSNTSLLEPSMRASHGQKPH